MKSMQCPKHWEVAKLISLTSKIGSGSTPRGAEAVYVSEGVPLIRSMNVHFSGFSEKGLVYLPEGEATKLRNVEVNANDVLLNITGASIGRVTIAPKTMTGARVNQHVAIVRPTEALNANFLRYYLMSPKLQDLIFDTESGMTRQALTKEKIENFNIPLPPLNEQKRISDKLDSLLARIDSCRTRLEQALKLLRRFRQRFLDQASIGKLSTDDEIDSPEFREDAVDIKELPSNWCWKPIAELIVEPLSTGISIQGSDTPPGTAVLKLSAMNDFGFNFEKIKYIDIPEPLINKLQLRQNDFFVSRGNGSLQLVGRGTLVAEEPSAPTVFPDLMIRLRLIPNTVSWISTIWSATVIRRQVESKVKTTAGIWKISQRDLNTILVPVPPKDYILSAPQSIQATLQRIRSIDLSISHQLENMDKLQSSILRKAFRGELVPQDLNDEPASELLARVHRVAGNEPRINKRATKSQLKFALTK